MLRVAQEVDVGFGAPVQRQSAAAQEALEGAVGPLFAEIACDGGAQILDRDAAPKQAQGRRDGAAVAADEGGRLQPLQGVRRPQQREAHIGGDVQAEAPGDAVHQLREIGAEQGGRAQERLAERTARDEVGPEAALPGDAGEKQRVGPDRKPGDETGAGAEGGAARPEQAAEEGRRDLGDGREGQKPDGGEGRLARAPVIHVGEEQHDGDGDAPHAQDEAAEIGRAGRSRIARHAREAAAAQHERQHEMVGDHDGEGHRFDDDHRGGGRQPAEKGREGDQVGAVAKRQRQHGHVAVDLAGAERGEAGEGERHHEDVDEDEIEREQPGDAAHVLDGAVLDDRHVELPGQQERGEARQEDEG